MRLPNLKVHLARHPGMRVPEETPEVAEQRRNSMNRASGLCCCEVCGHQYYDHPSDACAEWLNVLCDGRRVKL